MYFSKIMQIYHFDEQKLSNKNVYTLFSNLEECKYGNLRTLFTETLKVIEFK